jgi:hypothetical protein
VSQGPPGQDEKGVKCFFNVEIVPAVKAFLSRGCSMRVGLCLTLLFVGGLIARCGRAQTTSPTQEGKEVVLEVAGKTRPVPSRKGVFAPAVLHSVVEVMASPRGSGQEGPVARQAGRR